MNLLKTKLLGLSSALFCAFAALTANAATKYISWSLGSDSNNGNSTATPYKTAPGMRGSTHGWTPSAGDTIVFRGGDTWPSSCYQWLITWSGTAPSRITYGTDAAWYAGGSFTRPLFDFGNVMTGAGWTFAAGVLISSANYITFDNLEFANHRAPLAVNGVSNWGSTTICLNNSSFFVFANGVIRDWDQPTPISNGASGGGGIVRVNNGTDNIASNSVFTGKSTVFTGTVLHNIPTMAFCTVSNAVNVQLYGQLAHDNRIYSTRDQTGDATTHGNVFETTGDFTAYNNLIDGVEPQEQVILVAPNAGQLLVYNNVFKNVSQPCVVVDTDAVNPAGRARIYNNTLVGASGVGYCVRLSPKQPYPGLLDVRNNHFISQNPISLETSVGTYVHGSNLTNTLPVAESLGYTDANDYAPLDATKPTVAAAVDLSAYFTDDIDGNPRPSAAGLWNIGAYSFVPVTGAGTLTLSTSTASVAENAGSITVTAKRTGGSTGAVGCSYGTSAGTATPGVNYTTTMGTFSWAGGDSADKTAAVPIINASTYGNPGFSFNISTPTGGATLGTPATQAITIIGVGSPPVNVLPGLGPWLATDSDYAAPFTASGTTLSQATETLTTNGAGIAVFRFVLASPGNYKALPTVAALNEGANSFQVAVNAETPFAWHIVPTNSVAEPRYVTTNSTFETAGTLQVWSLPAGTNELVFYGREAGTVLSSLTMELVADDPPTDPPMVTGATFITADGYYKATSNIVLSVAWTTNVTVTGTPQITNNAGGLFTYTSGSGTANTLFTYTVLAGQNSQDLDHVATNSLALAGGTIKFGAVDAVLTLPAPGEPGSPSYGRSVVIDTLAPTLTIGNPSSTTTTGQDRFYAAVYSDLNFFQNTLTTNDVTLNIVGTATATLGVGPNNTGASQAVQLYSISGTGTLTITIAAGTGVDLAGNLAPGAGPSNPITVITGRSLNVNTTRAGTTIIYP